MLLKLLSAHESAPYLKPLTQTDLHSSLTLHTYFTSENEHFHFTKKRVSFNLLSPYQRFYQRVNFVQPKNVENFF